MNDRLASVATLALVLALLGVGAPPCSAQELPAVRELRAHRANYAARAHRTIRRIVLHTSEGSESSCVNTFRNPGARVSAHYLVSKKGRITRLVPDMSVAYHARRHNADSIGIENEGHAARNGWTTAQYQALAKLVRALCDRYGVPKDRRHIRGHSELPGARKGDPGRFFDWTRFMALVRGGGASGGGLTGALGATSSSRSIVEVTAGRLNVRATPGGSILGVVPRGARFVSDAAVPGWTRIAWRGRSAWVATRYVRRSGGTIDVVRVSALNVRAAPSTSAARLGKLARGQAYRRLDRRGVWVLIQFDQRQAWVHSAYTRTGTVP